MQIMSHRCCYCQKPFTRAGSNRHHEKYTCWKRLENGHFSSSPAVTRVDAPKVTFPNENNPGIPRGIEKGKAFRFKTPSSILIVGPSGCGKTCFTEVTLGSFGRFVCEPSTRDILLLRSVARWIPNHERSRCTISRRSSYHLPIVQMVSERGFTSVRRSDGRGRTRERVTALIHQTFTSPKYHMFPPGKYAKSISRNAHYVIAVKNPRDQLGVRNLLL